MNLTRKGITVSTHAGLAESCVRIPAAHYKYTRREFNNGTILNDYNHGTYYPYRLGATRLTWK